MHPKKESLLLCESHRNLNIFQTACRGQKVSVQTNDVPVLLLKDNVDKKCVCFLLGNCWPKCVPLNNRPVFFNPEQETERSLIVGVE